MGKAANVCGAHEVFFAEQMAAGQKAQKRVVANDAVLLLDFALELFAAQLVFADFSFHQLESRAHVGRIGQAAAGESGVRHLFERPVQIARHAHGEPDANEGTQGQGKEINRLEQGSLPKHRSRGQKEQVFQSGRKSGIGECVVVGSGIFRRDFAI